MLAKKHKKTLTIRAPKSMLLSQFIFGFVGLFAKLDF